VASAHRVLTGEANLSPSNLGNEAPQMALFRAA
jgi:hypothetical protein